MIRSPRLFPALFVALWATGFIGARYAMPWAEPFTFLAVRFVLAFALLALILMLRRSRQASRAGILNALAAGALMHGVYLGGVFWAIRHGMPAGISALIVGLQPLITAVLAGTLLGEKVLPRHWLGLAIGFAGVVTVLSPKFGTLGSGISAPTLAAAIIAVIGMSVGTVWQKRFGAGTDLVTGTLYQYLGAAVLMTAASMAFETRAMTINGELIFAMAWLVLVLSIGAIFLLMYLIREGEISKVASLFYLVPAVTAIMAWLLFGEDLSLVQICGMALTTLGVGLATAQPPTRARASR
ncbi:MAG: DMT family transporter [Mesorhizobium sp.]|jgi:drug/metabolite transporter (DMT)-like permease|nr:DMT family transporter [Mesorhizobium sp.]